MSILSDQPSDGIPGVTANSLGEQASDVIMDTQGTYTVTFKTIDQPVLVEIRIGTGDSFTQIIRYSDLDIPPNILAQLTFTSQGVENLRYDRDGDGAFESVVAPTTQVSGALAADRDAPTISVTQSVQTNQTQITLTAQDTGSGVRAIYYSLDGARFQPYTGPFTVNSSTTPTIAMFADDNVGNRSSWQQATVKGLTVSAGSDASVTVGQAVTFAGTVRDINPNDTQTLTWNFGDGSATTGTLTPTHTYVSPGTYTATLSATDSTGFTVSDSVTIAATAPQTDTTAPTITVSGVTQGGQYVLGAVPTASCTATDESGGSGLAGDCRGSVRGGTPNGVGTYTYTATATDQAGNTATQTITYRVIYRWDGFLQPINDTAHQSGTTTSIFKAGSTVPTKFQLKRADGTVVQANSDPQWLTPARGSSTSAPVDESVYADPATSGSAYIWNSGSRQYQYNWKTDKTQFGYYWRIGVTLDDGQTYYVNIGLR